MADYAFANPPYELGSLGCIDVVDINDLRRVNLNTTKMETKSRPWKRIMDMSSGRLGDFSKADSEAIKDKRFWQQLQNLRELKDFLLSEDVSIPDEELDNIHLGGLDGLSFSRKGRLPTDEERKDIDKRSIGLLKYLNLPLRRKRRLNRLRPYFRTLPILFLALAIASLILDSSVRYLHDESNNATQLGVFLDLASNMLWLIALGGLGTCGYLGTRLMIEGRRTATVTTTESSEDKKAEHAVVPDNAEIDLTDVNLITTRIVVGILFSFILALPVYQYHSYLHKLISGAAEVSSTNNSDILQNMGLTLLPFVLGFSTSLVLGIMERFVSAIGSLFGISSPTK